jgi:hypothetical protein
MVTAWPHDGIVPLELWDVLVGDATLFARRDEPTFYASLVAAALALRAGKAVREGGARLPASAWDAVALVGGALDESRARDAFDAAGVALDVVSDDPFFAASHAREALVELGPAYADAVVVDVGQTVIKGVGPKARIHRARPAAGGAADAREELLSFVGGAVADACAGEAPSFVLLALPCEVETRAGELWFGESTYPTVGESGALVREILTRGGCGSVDVAVVNDAVLAAWALAVRAPSQVQSRLVLTLGLGVGAALALRSPSATQ